MVPTKAGASGRGADGSSVRGGDARGLGRRNSTLKGAEPPPDAAVAVSLPPPPDGGGGGAQPGGGTLLRRLAAFLRRDGPAAEGRGPQGAAAAVRPALKRVSAYSTTLDARRGDPSARGRRGAKPRHVVFRNLHDVTAEAKLTIYKARCELSRTPSCLVCVPSRLRRQAERLCGRVRPARHQAVMAFFMKHFRSETRFVRAAHYGSVLLTTWALFDVPYRLALAFDKYGPMNMVMDGLFLVDLLVLLLVALREDIGEAQENGLKQLRLFPRSPADREAVRAFREAMAAGGHSVAHEGAKATAQASPPPRRGSWGGMRPSPPPRGGRGPLAESLSARLLLSVPCRRRGRA